MAPRFRSQKNTLRTLLDAPDWRSSLDTVAEGGISYVGPLMSFLLYEPMPRLRAAVALGRVTARLFETAPETARDVVRRLNWRMSEESGNIGWGVPEAVGEILSQHPKLAREYYKIFFSTILDLGFDDNYVDNNVLRRSCFFAIGRFVRACPQYGEEVRALLRRGLDDEDLPCRGYAAWALGMLSPSLNDAPALRRLADSVTGAVCELTDGDRLVVRSPEELARDTMQRRNCLDSD
ncbi:MAG: HEAT repeat domain-containing protein [Desulfovibrionaceae bacterium]|nr:HEAT repeat domain-containing protein [Desulfovibrionaceae bacterium]